MDSRPHDTSIAAWQVHRGIVAALTPEARVAAAIDLSDSIREIRIAGLLSRNPRWSKAEAIRQLVLGDTGIDLAGLQ
jgi:hypothetical protein